MKLQRITILLLATPLFIAGCASSSGKTVSVSTSASSIEEFIAENLHRPGRVRVIRYTHENRDPLLVPEQRLRAYCESRGGTLEKIETKGDRARSLTNDDSFFGQRLCRKLDTKLWAVKIIPDTQPVSDGRAGIFVNSPFQYKIHVAVKPIPVGDIRLPYCLSDQAIANRKLADEFIQNGIKVIPEIVDRSGFSPAIDPNALVQTSVEYVAECPATMDEVAFKVSVRAKAVPPYEATVKATEHGNLRYDAKGITVRPTVIINGRRYSDLYPPNVFADSNLRVEVSSIDEDFVRYRVHNLTNRYIELDAISIYVLGGISTIPLGKTLPPNSVTDNLRTKAPALASKVIPRTMTANDMKTQRVDIGVSAKYKIGNKSESLYRNQTFTYAQLIKD